MRESEKSKITSGLWPGSSVGESMSQYGKGARSVPGQGTDRNQPMSAYVSETMKSMFLSRKKKPRKELLGLDSRMSEGAVHCDEKTGRGLYRKITVCSVYCRGRGGMD